MIEDHDHRNRKILLHMVFLAGGGRRGVGGRARRGGEMPLSMNLVKLNLSWCLAGAF